jgi:hypothetical protein
MTAHTVRYYIRARSEDGPQYWDGANSWDSDRKGAYEYDTFEEAAADAARLNVHAIPELHSGCWCRWRGPARVNSIAKGVS